MLEKWKLIGKILSNKTFSIADVKVAYALLDHHNEKIRQVYPTNRRLKSLTGLSLRQIQLSTAKLHNHSLVHKMSIKGKNHYKLQLQEFENYEQAYARKVFTMNKPAPPTKPITNIDISKITKKIAKRTNPYYKAVINNGLGYHQNMENKLVRDMRVRLTNDHYYRWLDQLENKNTKDAAISYAKELCG